MDKLAPSPAHPAAAAEEPVKALSQRAVNVASSSHAEEPADPPAPAKDIDDEIRNHPLVDMDEVPVNDTEELARLGEMNLQDANAGSADNADVA